MTSPDLLDASIAVVTVPKVVRITRDSGEHILVHLGGTEWPYRMDLAVAEQLAKDLTRITRPRREKGTDV